MFLLDFFFIYISNVIPFPHFPSKTFSISHPPSPAYLPTHSCFPLLASPTLGQQAHSLAPPLGNPVLSPMDGCEHPLLYLSGSGRASQETAILGSSQQALVGIHIVSVFGDCIWDGSPGGAVSGWSFLQSLLHTLSL